MKEFFSHARSYIFRGLVALIPLWLCWIVIVILYQLIDKRVITWLNQFIDIRAIPGLGILLLLVFLYFIGLIASNVLGRQVFLAIERLSERIPLIKAIYGVGKQLSESLAQTEGNKQAFQRAVLVRINPEGLWTTAFVTGTIKDKTTGEELLKVFLPTVPNPTTGFVFIVHPNQTVDPGWTIEQALKSIISANIITPETINTVLK
jgi:uncharacterized membrane protein